MDAVPPGSMSAANLLISAGSWLVNLVFGKSILLRKIGQLSPNVSVHVFTSLLGTPVSVNHSSRGAKQYLYISKFAYITAITDSHDQVLMYSITTRRSDFNPRLVLGPYTTEKIAADLRLGKSVFADLDKLGSSGQVSSGLGNRRMHYVEEYYFGNPGLYQSYAFSLNDAGYVKSSDAHVINSGADSTDDERLKDFRGNSVINTYIITGPHLSLDSVSEDFEVGVDLDQVRMLKR